MVVSYSGIAGARGSNPTAIVLHNDAGSQGATAAFYKNWLESHTPSLGFAHYYVASDGTYQAEKDSNKAWHTGNSKGNANYLGIEVCQSMGNESTYLANEQKAFKLAADLCKKYGLNPASAVFPLHRELSSTSCPHRAWDLHGKGVAAIKQYFVDQIKKYYNGDSTSNNNSGSSTSTVTTKYAVGSSVKVKTSATHYQTGQSIASFVKGSTYKVKQVKEVNQSRSKYAFLLEGINSWVLGQDLESASSGSSSNSNSSTSLKGANLPNKGSYRFTATTNIRAAASTNSAIVGEYKAGQTVNYDSKVVAGGYVWLSWIGSESGKRRYSAVV
ncbi:N-acetylmuramoyl-L-alanine amidase [Enterococcus entomosocium]|uniref:N-acetylmuramoyl-L-alanine amidase n=1 Tax=Enterococcus entomosocium TaxID=3034352 RepID=UPI00384B7B50